MSYARRYKVAEKVLARCCGQHDIERILDDSALLAHCVHEAGGFQGDADSVRRSLEDALDEFDYRETVRRGG